MAGSRCSDKESQRSNGGWFSLSIDRWGRERERRYCRIYRWWFWLPCHSRWIESSSCVKCDATDSSGVTYKRSQVSDAVGNAGLRIYEHSVARAKLIPIVRATPPSSELRLD